MHAVCITSVEFSHSILKVLSLLQHVHLGPFQCPLLLSMLPHVVLEHNTIDFHCKN